MPDLFDGVIDSLYPTWHANAACHPDELQRLGLGPDIFYPTATRIDPRANDLCNRCPVATECQQGADENDEQHGIWAGTYREDTTEPVIEAVA